LNEIGKHSTAGDTDIPIWLAPLSGDSLNLCLSPTLVLLIFEAPRKLAGTGLYKIEGQT
jgi:hypothetical protein